MITYLLSKQASRLNVQNQLTNFKEKKIFPKIY